MRMCIRVCVSVCAFVTGLSGKSTGQAVNHNSSKIQSKASQAVAPSSVIRNHCKDILKALNSSFTAAA